MSQMHAQGSVLLGELQPPTWAAVILGPPMSDTPTAPQGRRAWLLVLAPALLAMLLASIPTVLHGPPVPVIEDEWGYLLTADTFVEGRLSNPSHPQWQSFESVHQFHVPTYNSKYPPAQALMLSIGQRLWHPILGVWLGVGLMIGSIVWMLLALVPGRWALIGGLVATIQYALLGVPFGPGTFAYWSQSYWGGALAAAGGALLYGALTRVLRKPSVGTSCVMAIGLLILANTRPMEGLIAALPAGLLMLVWMVRRRFAKAILTKVVLPTVVVLGIGFAAMGTYNKAVTGDALEMPWTTHYEQYCIFPLFIWQDLAPDKEWRHAEMQVFHGEVEAEMLTRSQSLSGLVKTSVNKLARFGLFFFGPLFLLPVLLFSVPLLRKPMMRFAMVPVGLVLLAAMAKFISPPHYSAPIAGLIIYLIVQGMRRLSDWTWNGKPLGRNACALILLGALGMAGYGLVQANASNLRTQESGRYRAEQKLSEVQGQHLVLVHFVEGYGSGSHWIWNRADIDASKVAFARDPGEGERGALLEHFADRKVWLVGVGFAPGDPELIPLER